MATVGFIVMNEQQLSIRIMYRNKTSLPCETVRRALVGNTDSDSVIWSSESWVLTIVEENEWHYPYDHTKNLSPLL